MNRKQKTNNLSFNQKKRFFSNKDFNTMCLI